MDGVVEQLRPVRLLVDVAPLELRIERGDEFGQRDVAGVMAEPGLVSEDVGECSAERAIVCLLGDPSGAEYPEGLQEAMVCSWCVGERELGSYGPVHGVHRSAAGIASVEDEQQALDALEGREFHELVGG